MGHRPALAGADRRRERDHRACRKPAFATEYWQYYYLVLVVVAVCTVLIGAARALAVRPLAQGHPRGRGPARLARLQRRAAQARRLHDLGLLRGRRRRCCWRCTTTSSARASLLPGVRRGPADVHPRRRGHDDGRLRRRERRRLRHSSWRQLVRRPLETLLGVVFVLVVVLAPDGLVGAWIRVVWSTAVRAASARARPPPAVRNEEGESDMSKGDQAARRDRGRGRAGRGRRGLRRANDSEGGGKSGRSRSGCIFPDQRNVAAAGTDMLHGWQLYWKAQRRHGRGPQGAEHARGRRRATRPRRSPRRASSSSRTGPRRSPARCWRAPATRSPTSSSRSPTSSG